ncbi:hypothetical protein RI129_008965 [Pyrocoelia pectoralis]|uniref:NADH dehydrogenase [ubiquinone] 1 beta subcomplex subunit 1 n=1 Tax=Pyrocoelia pectoralis TaxID=417401 RepID=A0AAN7VCF7_9COLE
MASPNYIFMIIPFIGYGFGWFLDRKETERMTLFRDKSALYGPCTPDPSRPPSWP